MDDNSWCEPLNLVKKKTKPVAVVAPSSVFDSVEKLVKKEEISEEVEDRKVVEDINKNCFIDSRNEVEEETIAVPNNRVHSVFHNLASCEQNFLTALYMRSLMAPRIMPPSNPFGSYPLSSGLVGNYSKESSSLSPLWAQQRFWQMVNWPDGMPHPKSTSSVTESLSINVPSFDTPVQTSSSILNVPSKNMSSVIADDKVSIKKSKQKR